MLKEAKKALRVTATYFDSEIASLLMAGANDLEIAGVVLPGTVSFTVSSADTVTDVSTLTDPLAMRAVITYAAMRFGNPPNYQQLADSYDLQKVQLMHAASYTDYGDEDEADEAGSGTAGGEDDSHDEG
jgi:hypothetical protein